MSIHILNGHAIRLHETPGAEPPVVLLHSSGLSGRQWRPLAAALGRRTRAPSLLGYEDSAPLPAHAGALQADLAVAEALILEEPAPVVLVGHSYGGMLSLRLAARHPARVRCLVLHEPVCWGILFSAGDPAIQARVRRFLEESDILREEIGGSTAWLQGFVDYWSGPGAWARMATASQEAFRRLGPKIFAEVRDLCLDRTPLSAYLHLTQPVWITQGEGSPVEERAVCALLSTGLSRGRLREIPGGHMAPIRQAAAFQAVVQEALGVANDTPVG